MKAPSQEVGEVSPLALGSVLRGCLLLIVSMAPGLSCQVHPRPLVFMATSEVVAGESAIFLLIKEILFMYLLMVVPCLHCCAWAFSSCAEWGSSPVGCTGFHCAGFSCCSSSGSRLLGFSSCGVQAQLLHSTWNLPGPGIKPFSPALAGRLLTTGPLGKSHEAWFIVWLYHPIPFHLI